MVMHVLRVSENNLMKRKRRTMKAFAYILLTILLVGFCVVGCSKDSGKSADELNAEAMKLLQSGQHDQALENAMAALEKSEKENGADNPEMATSLEILGLVYQAKGDAVKAESEFLRALSIVKTSYGPNSGQAAKIMNNLAGLYYAQDQYILAASFFKQSLAILEKMLPADDSRLATLQKNIDVCESMQRGEKSGQSADQTDSAGSVERAAFQPEASEQPSSVENLQDLVPQQVKESMTSQLAKQNIFISDLAPLPPVLIENRGMVFPYNALKKGKDNDSAQKIVILFAAIKNPENPNAMIFQQCRLISQTSYLAALEKGGAVQLKQELQEVFPGLYL